MSLMAPPFSATPPLTISTDSLKLSVFPHLGGSVNGISVKRDDSWIAVTRPTPPTVTSSSDTASFLMAPYPNRLRDGTFTFEGETHHLKFPEKHSIHGDVRNRPWSVVRATDRELELSFRSADFPDINFPFPFSMRQRFKVNDSRATISCSLTNDGTTRMPAGCGFHPYFNRALAGQEENVSLRFSAQGTYPFSGDIPLPEGMARPLQPHEDFSEERELTVALDHCFSGWRGPAELRWSKSGVRLIMEASPNMSHLVLYSPPGKSFFALEPQSQMTDGFNFYARGEKDTGVTVLNPGETLDVWFTLTVPQASR